MSCHFYLIFVSVPDSGRVRLCVFSVEVEPLKCLGRTLHVVTQFLVDCKTEVDPNRFESTSLN